MCRVKTAVARALALLGAEAGRMMLTSPCLVCGRELPWRARMASCCETCWRLLPRLAPVRCTSCALPLPAPHATLCIRCHEDPLPVAWCDAWGAYRGSLERLLHAFKFERHDFLDAPFAELLHEALREREELAFDAIVPVPMTRAKFRRRGYNQAELLARRLAARIGGRVEPLLAKRGDGPAQSTLIRDARRENVRGAFTASPRAAGRSILIVDDICTTGETMRACAAALVASGAARVAAIAVAKAT